LRLPFGLPRERGPADALLLSPDEPGGESSIERAPAADKSAKPRKPLLRSNFVLGALLVALTLAVYGQTCGFSFIVLDDPSYVKWNRFVLDGLKLSSVRWAVTQFNDSNWIPLTWLSLMLDATIYHNWPDGYHITNVLLHVFNVLLVFTVFTRMTQSAARSAFAAALFAVHPLHVESVAWITERKDVLCTLFGLLSLWSYVSYAQTRRRWQYAASFGCLTLSLLAKQTFVTLPCVFLLLDYWPLKRFGIAEEPADSDASVLRAEPERLTGWRRLVIEKIPFFALVAAFSAIAVLAQSRGGIRSLESVPFGARVLNAISAYGWYAWKALVPLDLAVFYPHPIERLRPIDVVVPAAFLAAATSFALVNVRRRPYLIVGWLWYLGTLFPLIGLIQIGKQRVADRYAYLPLLGLYLAVAWLVPSLVPNWRLRRWVLSAAAVGAIAVYAFLGFKQVALWSDDVKLFQHALAVTENNAMSRCSLGCALLGQGDAKGAIANMEESIRLDPDDALTHDDLGSAYQADKRLKDAAREYRKSIELKEDSASPHEGLGTILSEWHQYDEARKEFNRALEIEPKAAMTFYNLSRLCEDQRHYDEAITYAERGLEADPKHVECQRQIAHVLAAQGRIDDALDAYKKVIAMAPADTESRIRIHELTEKKSRGPSAKN
jgi:protein O-mannosyl-transferase